VPLLKLVLRHEVCAKGQAHHQVVISHFESRMMTVCSAWLTIPPLTSLRMG